MFQTVGIDKLQIEASLLESIVDTNVNQSAIDSVLVVVQHYELAPHSNKRENIAATS